MTTLGDLVTTIQRQVLSDLREETNQLGASMGLGVTNMTLAPGYTLGSIQPGAIVQVDYELMFVTAASSTSSITVIRAYYDTVQAVHPNNSLINVNPRFPAVDIITAINQDIDSYSAPGNGLFQMLEVTLTYIPVIQGYDLTGLTNADVLEIWEVRAWEYGPSNKFPIISPREWQLQRNADTDVFPSGMSLVLNSSGYPGRPLRVQYKAPYTTPLVNATDNVQTVTGLHSQANDIPRYGAPAILMQFRELKRSFSESQGEPRRAQEVPVGSSLTAAKGLLAMRQTRLFEERARLEKMYPRRLH